MVIFLFLKKNTEVEGITVKTFRGHRVYDEGEISHIMINNFLLCESLSKEVLATIETVSVNDSFSYMSVTRIMGEYKYQTAKAVLTHEAKKSGQFYELSIVAKNIGDARKLYELIRSGRVRPDISYEEKPVSKPINGFYKFFRNFRELLQFPKLAK